jgi:hypothetical protein
LARAATAVERACSCSRSWGGGQLTMKIRCSTARKPTRILPPLVSGPNGKKRNASGVAELAIFMGTAREGLLEADLDRPRACRRWLPVKESRNPRLRRRHSREDLLRLCLRHNPRPDHLHRHVSARKQQCAGTPEIHASWRPPARSGHEPNIGGLFWRPVEEPRLAPPSNPTI